MAAPCQHFGDCGGCNTQNLAYHAQLHQKEQQVHDLISRIGRFGPSEAEGSTGKYLKPIVPCEKQFHYRNKMEFSFGTQKWTPREELESCRQCRQKTKHQKARPKGLKMTQTTLPWVYMRQRDLIKFFPSMSAYCRTKWETSDGLWDVMSQRRVLNFIQEAHDRKMVTPEGRKCPPQIAEGMVEISLCEVRPIETTLSSSHPSFFSRLH